MKVSPCLKLTNLAKSCSPIRRCIEKRTSDTFELQKAKKLVKANYPNLPIQSLADKKAQEILSKFSKFSAEDYKKLSITEKLILRTATFGFCPKQVCALDEVSDVFKYFYDKNYGEGNYVFISIGRSLEQLGEALKLKGVETKLLPLSHVREWDLHDLDKIFSRNGVEKYFDYLKKQGIDFDTIRNSKKHFVFGDYCYSGNTMEFVRKMYSSNKPLLKNLHFLNISMFYGDMYEKYPKFLRTSPQRLDKFLALEGFKEFPLTSPLPIVKLADVDDIANLKMTHKTKLFNFKLFDKILSQTP